MLKSYLKKIFTVFNRGDAREESYYSILEGLLKEYTESIGKRKIHITTLPKKTEAGNPDFRIWDGKQHIVGYIEAKPPTVENLDQVETTEQLKRYLDTFPNLVLTNFFEFRLYRNGTLIDKVLIGRPFVIYKLKTVPPVEKESEFMNLFDRFFSFSFPKVYDARALAIELAKRTRFLKYEVIAQELKEEENIGKGFILGFYEAFRKYLISGLSKEDFVDLYSQTITYGLFAARTRSKNGFNRKLAYDRIPRTIGILRDIFRFISLEDLPQQMECIIDDISGVLAVTDVKNILHKYFHEGKGKDPIVHFYETFLAEYDPGTRVKRGIYYTPEPVVSYIVRSLHLILKEYFRKENGFANDSVTVLDPAAGTLTFLVEAAKWAVEEFVFKYGEGGKENFIKEHILKNFYAFELMMAPYAVGHLKMSFLLEELGYRLHEDERFKLYLTNTLEMEELAQSELPGMTSLSEESHLAGEVKKEQPILVILGNPPYSVSSANKSKFLEGYFTKKEGVNKRGKKQILRVYVRGILDDYKEAVKKERNIQPLSDDYVKFIRFSQWKIGQVGNGVIGMITNNSYLSGLIHRGMREKLLESFNKIYILNLHGNARIGEKCPDGSKDENVFDIMQGVSIALFIRNKEKKGLGKVFYQDIYGLREIKYDYLNKNDVKSTKWKELQLFKPYYFFVEKDFLKGYDKLISVNDIFILKNIGVASGNDKILVDFGKNSLIQKFSLVDKRILRLFLESNKIRTELINVWIDELERLNIKELVKTFLYHPFDNRWIVYNVKILQRARYNLMRHLLRSNIALICVRQAKSDYPNTFITDCITNRDAVTNHSYVFPLYLYTDTDKKDLFNHTRGDREPNFNPVLLKTLSEAYQKESTPEDIFYYIYAICYSNIYCTKYAEFLKIDFPRIPFTKRYKLFSKMVGYGRRLVNLHLLKSTELDLPIVKIQGKGEKRVQKLKYDRKEKRVYFNQNQYFEGVTKQAWEYYIGAYQVCNQWLKDRKGKKLSLDDIKHYCNVVTSLQKTIEIQKAIDDIYPEVEEGIVEFKDR